VGTYGLGYQPLAHPVRPLRPKPLRHLSVDLDAAGGQAISACGGDARKTLNALIAANDFLRN
jgi:hypothetical protein